MKIALVHDWLHTLGGAERVLIELHKLFPGAPIYTLFARQSFIQKYLPNAKIIFSSLQKMPWINRLYRFYGPFMPMSIEGFDFSAYDIVISSSVLFSKGLILKPKTRHLCYCYSPARMLWDRSFHYEHGGKLFRHFLRLWDQEASNRVDTFIAISKHVQKRIKKYYGRDSLVVYPPVCLPLNSGNDSLLEPYYLVVARLYPHKNLEMVIDAFNKLSHKLIIIGDGPLKHRFYQIAGRNITLLGGHNDEQLAYYYKHCQALILPNEEDFGLTAVEAMQAGRPVLALRSGGALETVIEGVTGEFFDDPISEALADGLKRLEHNYQKYDSRIIQQQALKFSQDNFRKEITKLIYGQNFSHHS